MSCRFPTDALLPTDTRLPGCSPTSVEHILRISFDDPGTAEEDRTWVPFESRLRAWDVNGGRDSELADFDATVAEYILDNRDRELDPTNAASSYAPDVVPNRMIWHRVDVDGTVYDVFKGYINGWGPEWSAHGRGDHTAHIRATDGKKLLGQAAFTSADPDVLEYSDVVSADQPSFYYRLGEPAGTKVVHHIRRKKRKRESRHHFNRHKRRSQVVTAAEVEGISGPSGTYKNTPTLGEPGAIVGDADTCVRFTAADSEYAVVQLEDDDLRNLSAITIEAWVKLATDGDYFLALVNPLNATNGYVALEYNTTPFGGFRIRGSGGGAWEARGTNAAVPGTWYHVCGTWTDADDPQVYVNGVNETSFAASGGTYAGAATPKLYIGAGDLGSGAGVAGHLDGWLDEVAVYEEVLSAERIAAHYNAGALGFASGKTGNRIEDILTLAGTPAPWAIQTGQRTMLPDRYAGVEPLAMVDAALDAEGEPSIFYFTSTNVPRFLDSDYRSVAPYNSPRFSFGGGNTKFEDAKVDPDDSFLFNDIRGTTEDGNTTFRASDATSITRFGRLTLPLDSLPIDNDADIQSYVDDLLARYKDPLVRIPSFSLSSADPDRREAMLSLELGDCVDISVPIPGGGAPLAQTSYIERRHLWQEQGSTVIRGEFSISPR